MGTLAQVVTFFHAHAALLLAETGSQAELCAVALAVAFALAFPAGVIAGHLHRGAFLAVSAGNVLRALPTLAIIALGIALYGGGYVNILVALVVLVVPIILANTCTAVDGADPAMVEAARGMGLTGWQIIARVELPGAVPLVMAGVRTSAVYVVAGAYVAAFAGYTGTLGDIITNEGSYRLSGVLAATAVSIALALAAEAILAGIQRLLMPKGLLLARSAP
jgi:osmoprotectant transport system permease protein